MGYADEDGFSIGRTKLVSQPSHRRGTRRPSELEESVVPSKEDEQAVFKSLLDADVIDAAYPLGTDTRAYVEPIEDDDDI